MVNGAVTAAPGTSRRAFWLTLLGCLAIAVLRDVPGALAPPILLEDATEMLSFYWRDADPARILRFYNGYISLGPNLVGYVAGQLPGGAAPYLLHWAALAMAAATFAALQIRGMAVLGLTTGEKAVIALTLALLPLGNWALVTNTTYTLWNMLIFSTLLVLFWQPQRGAGSVALFALLVVFSWSHPLFILLAPVLAVRIYLADSGVARAGFALLLASVAAYMVFGVDVTGRPQEIDTGGPVALVLDSLWMFFSRGVAEPLISSRLRAALAHRGLVDATVAFGALAMVMAGAAAWRWRATLTRRDLWQVAALVLFAGLFTAASAASGLAPIEAAWGQRYTYPANILLLLPLFSFGLRGLQALPRRRAAGLAAAGLVWLAALNALDRSYYRSLPANRAEAAAVVAEAAALSATGAPYCVMADRGRWSIRLAEDWPARRLCTRVGRPDP